MLNSPKKSAEHSTWPSFLGRAARHFVFIGLRMVWNFFRRLSIHLPPGIFLRHPLDKKTGVQLVDDKGKSRVLVVCDFAAFPLSFDILCLLTAADNHRRQMGVKWLDFAFIAHDGDPYSDLANATNPVTGKDYRSAVFNLGLAATRLFEAAGHVLFFTDRKNLEGFLKTSPYRGTNLFPKNYHIQRPNFSPVRGAPPLYGMVHLFTDDAPREQVLSLRAPKSHLKLAQGWVDKNTGPSRVVTITLRESTYLPKRNSNTDEWRKLVESFAAEDIKFVVLRDFYAVYGPSPLSGANVVECPEAVLDMPLRAALYELADLNLMSAAGPTSLCYLNANANYIAFDPCADPDACDEADMLYQNGIKRDENFPGSGPFQKLVWKEETFPVIREETDAMLAKLDKPIN